MKRLAILIVAGAIAALAVPTVGLAQAPTDKSAPMTGMKPDRTTANKAQRKAMMEKEAALKKKRAECRAKAKAEKVSLVKRPAYVKRCMSN
jgi:hypothetical protein